MAFISSSARWKRTDTPKRAPRLAIVNIYIYIHIYIGGTYAWPGFVRRSVRPSFANAQPGCPVSADDRSHHRVLTAGPAGNRRGGNRPCGIISPKCDGLERQRERGRRVSRANPFLRSLTIQPRPSFQPFLILFALLTLRSGHRDEYFRYCENKGNRKISKSNPQPLPMPKGRYRRYCNVDTIRQRQTSFDVIRTASADEEEGGGFLDRCR